MVKSDPSISPGTLSDDILSRVSIVIAAFNEEAQIESVVREVRKRYPQVVVVDDGSEDRTAQAARQGGALVLRHLINRGQGAALQTGIECALKRGAAYIVTFDADGQHAVEDIEAMLIPIVRGECEITLGSRFLGSAVDMPRSRRLVLKLGILFTHLINRMPLTDTHNGFRAFSRQAAEHIQITADRMAHASEMIDLVRESGLPWREIPVQIRYTEYSMQKGQSSRGAWRIVLQYLFGRLFP